MKCIMVRLDGYKFINISHDWYGLAADVFTRTEIIDIIGKLLCIKLKPAETPMEGFNETIMAKIGYVVDRRNSHLADPDAYEAYWSDDEKDKILEYFVQCYKLNLPYIPDIGDLKFMACVWHEDLEFMKSSVCLVAEHRASDECVSKIESGDCVREPCEGDGADRGYLSAVFK